MSLLQIEDLSVAYGQIEALKGISLAVEKGEVVTILGANGAGKTTMMRAISSLIAKRGGRIMFEGHDVTNAAADRIVRLGIVQSPEGRRVFGTLNVAENLTLGGFTRPASEIRSSLASVYRMFPHLAERERQLAGTLSGGEQQMLAIGRGLMAEPKLLILDEPSLGLSPLLVEELFALIARIHADGVAVLLVEQNVVQSLDIAGRAYILAEGQCVMSGAAADIGADPQLKRAYLGL